MAGPLFPNQRGAQRHAVQLLNVEEKEELQSVHRQLVHKGEEKKEDTGYLSICSRSSFKSDGKVAIISVLGINI